MRTKTKKAVIALLAMTTAIAASANLGDTWQQAAARHQENAQVRARPGVNMYFVPKEWSIVEAFNPKTGFSDSFHTSNWVAHSIKPPLTICRSKTCLPSAAGLTYHQTAGHLTTT